ncbi:hypothetical protein AB0O76_05865 [Streptomyces sp. NPDC086554]|uniref:hypothetical protein n=1 Tax=Streptomyces sp. NPDC086554 TaxID=3154864 RepID=UPI003434CB74
MLYLWLAGIFVILLIPVMPWIMFPGHRRLGILVGILAIVAAVVLWWWWPAGYPFHIATLASALARISLENSGALEERRTRRRRKRMRTDAPEQLDTQT